MIQSHPCIYHLHIQLTVRCDADLRCGAFEALCQLSNGVVRLFLSTVWTELWSIEYMGNIHTSEVASPIVPKLWGVTQIWEVVLVRLCYSCRTAMFVCFYRPSGLSFGQLNIEMVYTCVRLPHLLCQNCEVWRRFERWCFWGSVIAVERRCPFFSIDCLDWALVNWIHG